jgi:hypothetical protein
VYIGNMNGELIALYPNGTQRWKQRLDANPNFGAIHASPVVTDHGYVYVVSGQGFNDRRAGHPAYGSSSFLHQFHAGTGQLVRSVALPLHGFDTGATVASPNIWSFNGDEAIMLMVRYGYGLHLIAFSTDLRVIDDLPLYGGGDLTGGPDWPDVPKWAEIAACVTNPFLFVYENIVGGTCRLDHGFRAEARPESSDAVGLYRYLSYGKGLAIRQLIATESPHIFALAPNEDYSSNGDDTYEYLFNMNSGFVRSPVSYTQTGGGVYWLTTPVALANGELISGDYTGIRFVKEKRSLFLGGRITATPTLTPNGRIAVVDKTGMLTTIVYGNFERQYLNSGPSIASAASSCTHLFVATEIELVTYDLATMLPVYRLPWLDGGQHSTIIGPFGHVYATTEHGIYVFPPVPNRNAQDVAGTQCK